MAYSIVVPKSDFVKEFKSEQNLKGAMPDCMGISEDQKEKIHILFLKINEMRNGPYGQKSPNMPK